MMIKNCFIQFLLFHISIPSKINGDIWGHNTHFSLFNAHLPFPGI